MRHVMRSTAVRFGMLLAAICLIYSGALSAQPPPEKARSEGVKVIDRILPMPQEQARPIQTEKIDQAAAKFGKGVDWLGERASDLLGKWVNGKAFADVTWLKLIFCVFLIFMVVIADRMLRALIRMFRRRRIFADEKMVEGKNLFLDAVGRPLILFLWVYGIYGAFSPLFVHFEQVAGGRICHATAKKMADIGGTIALVWFIYLLIRLGGKQLEKWASSTQSNLSRVVASMLQQGRGPLKLLIALILIQPLFPLFREIPQLLLVLRNSFSLFFIAAIAWLIIRTNYVLEDVFLGFYKIDTRDNLAARKVHTQIRFLRRLVVTVVIVIAAASMLMTFEKVRQLGTSILASAGIFGIVVGLAAQRSIANLLVGLQIAITQPIRIDDVVIVENEWGRIEEITSTYVVVKIWDLRRLIVPLTHFTEKPFQNWTRVSADLLGTVFLYVDYSVPVDAIRGELHRILQGSEMWDGKVWGLQVTNSGERTMELRALMSAVDASMAWNLRCEVREKLITFVQQNYPESLPRIRTAIEPQHRGDASRQLLSGAVQDGATQTA